MQDRTYIPPVIDPSGKSRVDSSAAADAIEELSNQKQPSVSSNNDNEKLAEAGLKKGVTPDLTAEEEEFESYGFAHPAASRPQRIVWIPEDTLGLTAEEVRGCEEARVRVGCSNAKVDEKGKVDVDGPPPGAPDW